MKFLFDFFPVLAFFIAFFIPEDSQQGIYLATKTIIVASLIQVSLYWVIFRRFEKLHVITLIVVLIFGSLTLYLQDERFIKWKPTVVLWVIAVGAFAGQFLGKKNLFRGMIQMADNNLTLPDTVWHRLNLSLIVFYILLGGLNLYVAFSFTTELWVKFKTFGIVGMNLIFVIGQVIYMSRYLEEPVNAEQDK